jgi:hypothetical protein
MSSSADRQYPSTAWPSSTILTDFYREEFLKRQTQLRLQREYYSERAVASAEAAMDRVLAHLETLCASDHADQLVSRLLRSFDAATGGFDVIDPKKVH